jgi:hypothetical protein
MDFGNPEERAVALRVALAAKELNSAMLDAARIGISIDVEVLSGNGIESLSPLPIVMIGMERRTMILPAERGAV